MHLCVEYILANSYKAWRSDGLNAQYQGEPTEHHRKPHGAPFPACSGKCTGGRLSEIVGNDRTKLWEREYHVLVVGDSLGSQLSGTLQICWTEPLELCKFCWTDAMLRHITVSGMRNELKDVGMNAGGNGVGRAPPPIKFHTLWRSVVCWLQMASSTSK